MTETWQQPMTTDESDAFIRGVGATPYVPAPVPEEMRWRTGAIRDRFGFTIEFAHRPLTARQVAAIAWKILRDRDLHPKGQTLRNRLWWKHFHLRDALCEYQVRGHAGMTQREFFLYLNGVNDGASNALRAAQSND